MAAITRLSQLDMNGTYSYEDYLLWQLKERVELIKGKILEMSPRNSNKEINLKFGLYQKAGVREYWIISPLERNVLVYTSIKNKLNHIRPLAEENLMESVIFPNLNFIEKKYLKINR